MGNVYEGKPDARQHDAAQFEGGHAFSRFRPRYRALSPAEVAFHDALKAKAAELEELLERIQPGRYRSLALTSLEEAIMWGVKELTGPGTIQLLTGNEEALTTAQPHAGLAVQAGTMTTLQDSNPHTTAELEALARISHEVNRVWCEHNGDASQVGWTAAPDWQRESARAGVGFHWRNPDASDAASHEAWSETKLAEGWSYGPTKDPANKLHPCLVRFDQLPPEQQFKDRLFRTVCAAGFGRTG